MDKAVTLRTWDRVRAFARAKALFRDGDAILLAVSGGPDSMAMLDLFARFARARNLRLSVAHLDHGIRGREAAADSAFVEKEALARGLKFCGGKADVPALARKTGLGLEAAAREARYRFLASAAKKTGARLAAAAHHADDHAETVLMNLLRGTEPKGLLGIPVKRPLAPGVTLIRPMACLKRSEIEDYLKANRVRSRKDRTNDDEKHTRNWVRRTLIPLMERRHPRLRERLVELSVKLSRNLKD